MITNGQSERQSKPVRMTQAAMPLRQHEIP